jgi:hypothetical protein
MSQLWAVLVFGILVAVAAFGINVWATWRVARFPFSNGQRAAQIALIWLIPGFCLLSLLVTRAHGDHPSSYQGPDYPFDFYPNDSDLFPHRSGHDVPHHGQ